MDNKSFARIAVWVLVAVVLFTVFRQFDATEPSKLDTTSYTQFMEDAKSGKIRRVDIQGSRITVTPQTGSEYTLTSPGDLWMVDDLRKSGVQVYGKAEEEPSLLLSVFVSWFPMLLLIGVWIFFMRRMQGGGAGGGAFSFGKSKARMLDDQENKVRFKDVAGCDEAKEDVQEIVDFLRDPNKFQRLGGRIPRGVLLVGSPGTGKTLLAKAIAGEAGVPFFTISGSDFVEMFVGVGAARVRDMFETAKKNSPCIIFIDEIDAVGRQRGAGLGGGNDEREQTLNQMLVEMDGFDTGANVIVIAATNRPDVLDPALLRPGRFDRQVVVPLPDIRGREQILNVHMRKIPVGADIDAAVIARGTPGFSGADLANLVNEAALFAARRNGRVVKMVDFENAKDKIMMGSERRAMVMNEEERRNTAYHESGHAVVAYLLPKSDPVHKVTIVPRGRALGLTMQLPTEDHYSYDRQYLLTRIAILFGGRIAEEVFMHQMTTGASNDFERATQLARDMVTRYGMSERMGPMVYAENEGEVFLGRSVTKTTHVSERTMQEVDAEIRRIIDEQYAEARRLIEENADKMHVMAKALLDWETIDADQIADIMAGKTPRPPKDWTPKDEKGKAAKKDDEEKSESADKAEKAEKADDAQPKETTDRAPEASEPSADADRGDEPSRKDGGNA
ncbi:ATP-dependent zinc metalloprotease FtsH [Sutterella megalosphaeroides]|uniref:ATP-dependent zinc metalloprotease FtsH n=1 Tax=Sutterella megalosphaeroides TaxID=2494234 RepID=A0A2Z6ICS2_9BURK|nr:ATP-dependent zinc metalloprotease FtsH [Sutterella megalosphaeroides]BBF24122.1 ATP-dependent zinc metalloprotease FtsH [Sutterella megalosphaeroides]